MKEQQIKVINSLGIHARPASMIVQTAIKFKSQISIIKESTTADAKSIMNVLMLGAECGTTVTIRANGADEQDAVAAVVLLFEQKFKEE
ncbi:MAG TPA: HPr family phosphocarrier protein [Chitinispirillaceae bacterium]|nr:HPr family phosphocarrier protein [Chitinispirillaceae bacterium]